MTTPLLQDAARPTASDDVSQGAEAAAAAGTGTESRDPSSGTHLSGTLEPVKRGVDSPAVSQPAASARESERKEEEQERSSLDGSKAKDGCVRACVRAPRCRR